MSFFDWLGRVIMLVLAGMITLSIIGSIAAIPSGSSIERQIGIERTEWPQAPAREPPPAAAPEAQAERPEQAQPSTEQEPGAAGQKGESQVAVPAAPPPAEPIDPTRWLEVIAYALLALVGLAAFGVLIGLRSLHHRRRIADALEALPPRSPL